MTAQSPPVEIRWSVDLGAKPAAPLVGLSNSLVVPVQAKGTIARYSALHAYHPDDGHLLWRQDLGDVTISGLGTWIETDNSQEMVVVGLSSNDLLRKKATVHAFDGSGDLLWSWTGDTGRVSAPLLAGGKVFLTTDSLELVALSIAGGGEMKRINLDAPPSPFAPAHSEGTLYIPCRSPHLIAISADGDLRWQFEDSGEGWLDKTPVVSGERLLLASTHGEVLALQRDTGRLLWRLQIGLPGHLYSPVAVAQNLLYVGAQDGLYALEIQLGRIVWTYPTHRPVAASPTVVNDVVYAGCHDHHLYALDAGAGIEMWHYVTSRRIEMPPLSRPEGNGQKTIIFVVDRRGSLAAIRPPASGEELESAGDWQGAANAYVSSGQFARAAELLERQGQLLHAARLWQQAGEAERAAIVYEESQAWYEASQLWNELGRPRKQARALVNYAHTLAATDVSKDDVAAFWETAATLFKQEGETEEANICWQQVARLRHLPVIHLEVSHGSLVLGEWSRLQFTVRNQGFGPAKQLIIHAKGDRFEGQITATRRIASLLPGRERTELLDVSPRAHGQYVPLRITVEYKDNRGKAYVQEQTIYMKVALNVVIHEPRRNIEVFDTSGLTLVNTNQDEDNFDLTGLHNNLVKSFNKNELYNLIVFELHLDYEAFPESKDALVRELVLFLKRRNRLNDLFEICERLRPNLPWR